MRLFLLFPHKYFGLTTRLDLKPFTNRYEIQTSYFNSDITFCFVNGEKHDHLTEIKTNWSFFIGTYFPIQFYYFTFSS